MGQSTAALLAACLALLFCSVRGQDTQSVNAQNRFNIAGTIYNKTGTLLPLHFNLYGIPVPSNYSNPDILLTLNATTGGTGLNVYCNPGYGAFADPNGNYPGPGYAQWFSDLSTTVNQVFISKNDPYYKSPAANDSTSPFFICSVINNDANTTTNYTLAANIISANRTLDQGEQGVLNTLYSRCCRLTGACNAWKAQNSGFVNANGGTVDTDFCTFPNQICSPTGNLYRLNLDNYNLSCSWPGDLLSQFSQLSTLSLNSNAYLMGNTSAVFDTVQNLTSLQFLDLSGDTGIKGSIDSGTAHDKLCSAVQGNLVSLNLNSMGLSGGIPSCLYSQGSSAIALDLGSNNFTGSLQNSIPVNSSLQLLHVDLNRLTGTLPPSLANAIHLVDLDTTMNLMTGTIPEGVGAIRTLQSFVVKMNNHTGRIPDSFGTALNLQVFDVKQNMLTGLPAAWTNASYNAINSSYINIRASLNQIQGSFPVGLVNAPQLTYLILNENQLSGPLPSNNSIFPNLRALNVSVNSLNGTIPAAWGQSAIFSSTPLYLQSGAVLQQVFDLSYNRFTGSLPSFLSQQAVPSWTRSGIYLRANDFDVSCQNGNYSYIADICPNGTATTVASQGPAAMAAIPPRAGSPSSAMGQSTQPPTGSMTAVPGPNVAKPTSTAPATVSTQSSEQKSSNGGLSGGAVAGIVIGVLAAAALAIFIAFFACRRKQGGKSVVPQLNGGTFSMPTFDGEFGRKSSLKKGLTSLSSNNSGFERFNDAQHTVELSPSQSYK